MSARPPVISQWQFIRVTDRIIRYSLTAKSIAMTGSAVNTDFNFPVSHRLVRVELKHNTTADADSADQMTATLFRKDFAGYLFKMRDIPLVVGDIVMLFGETFEFEAQDYRLQLNTTNTDKVYPSFYFQLV